MSEAPVPNAAVQAATLAAALGAVPAALPKAAPAAAPPAAPPPPPDVLRPSRMRLYSMLPRWSATALQVRNHAYAAGPTLIGDDRVMIWQENGLREVSGELACRIGDWPLYVAADNLSRIEPRLEGLESMVPEDIFAALIEHAMSPVLDHLERLAGVPVDGAEFLRQPDPARQQPDEVRIGFQVFDARLVPLIRGWVRMAAEAWQALDFSRAPVLPSSRQRIVPIRLAVRVAAMRLPLHDVLVLQPGDALRTGVAVGGWPTDGLPVDLTDPSQGIEPFLKIHARLVGHDIVLEDFVSTASESRPPDSAAGSTDLAQDIRERMGEIECEVTFELGSLRMTVAEVARLRNGQAIRLGSRLQDQPVSIMVNGRQLARGELAALGDELVVVVTDTHRFPQV